MSKAKTIPATSAPVEHDYDSAEGVSAAVLAAKAGDTLAAETIARRLSWILSGEVDLTEAQFDELIAVAESGWNSILSDSQCHPDDMFQYAVDILWDDEGSLIPENAEDAAAWMLRAAEGDHPDAQLEVGRLYLDGVGLKQSTPLAIEWFKKAAKDKDNAEHAEFFLSEIKKKSGKVAAKKAAAKKPSAKKAPAKKPAAKAVKKVAPAKKAPAKKVVVKKPAAKKVVAKKPVAKKAKVAAKPAKAVAKKIARPAVKKAVAKPVKQVAKPAAKKKAPAKRK